MDYDLADLPTCTRCALASNRQRVVVGTGPTEPVLMVIGEAPGATEDEGGAPFIGRSGLLLFRLIEEEVGVTREQCFVTNVVKCRPPNNRVPEPEELEACRPWMSLQLAAVRPRVLLALGNTAARELFGFTDGIGRTHGNVRTLGAARGLATYHPAAALRDPSIVKVMRADLRTVRRLVDLA